MAKQTPLFPVYEASGAKTVNFGGWQLPVQFSGIKHEHETVRTKAGIFDVSHMGEIEVKGKGTLSFLQYMMSNDVSKVKEGRCQYTALCQEDGGTIDDLVWYKRSDESALLVVNASNETKDFDWLLKHSHGFDVQVENRSSDYAQLAVQGPLAESVVQRLTDESLVDIRFFSFREGVTISGHPVLISRTGYTGEDGFEIYCDPESAAELWEAILQEGKQEGLLPCGLGARDTLRFEANLALYGQELSEEITPVEAGIGFAVKPDIESDFIGKDVLKIQKEEGSDLVSVGIEMLEKGIPRTGYEVLNHSQVIGHITSGTQSPTLGKNMGLALVSKNFSKPGTEIDVQVRKKQLKAMVIETPFYKRN
ncbi:glycine cleavage system aminomethyltransferase GcvT [Salisediminibacterium beveridgei]|uniref:Aminomethyltransferase n=1 Tax=Salisediminibacterium beveridgei TaxID=632773 RepID=A0A1D7QUG3_9BACI|nr:glycine cleavage system aminomethyltransferase GcvT [Salisediminibacterium beveridgei]AOM82653.1 Aminomethyltransferase (glycine cleavage system T protein) [Salisediminibacterium beveridgei]